ncbi:14613_t:CDS:2 [Acaulospora colombiana]|uniref:14613_t:CDS:1 n=1 Tax=Acaulospora colombiana TaxID=27376 RepID=A0ACA9MZU9_9GLOM|nr:14613_t:CDS:2 [Acaulospora colombiana]
MSAVDLELDYQIQSTITEEMGDATVLTIAHGLRTVVGYDRILVLDQGRIVEFDTPQRLLEQEDRLFARRECRLGRVGEDALCPYATPGGRCLFSVVWFTSLLNDKARDSGFPSPFDTTREGLICFEIPFGIASLNFIKLQQEYRRYLFTIEACSELTPPRMVGIFSLGIPSVRLVKQGDK